MKRKTSSVIHSKIFLKKKNAGKKGKRLKVKLLSKIIAISVSICAVLGSTTLFLLYQNSMQSMKDEVKSATGAYALAVKNSLDKYITAVSDIASSTYLTDSQVSDEKKQALLDTACRVHGFFKVRLVDRAGKTLDGLNVSGEDYFKEALGGRFYLSSTYLSQKDNGMEVSMSIPIMKPNDSSNTVASVLICSLPAGTLNGLVNGISIGQTGYGFITDGTGKIVADKNLDNILNSVNYIEMAKKDPSYSGMAQVVQNMVQQETGGQEVTMKGQKLYTAYQSISGGNGWSICVVAVESEMMQNLYFAFKVALALLAVFILLGIFIAGSIASPIVKPILALSGRIGVLADGDLHTPVPEIRTGDEIQDLSHTFKDSVSSLNGYIGEISNILNCMAEGDFTRQAVQEYRGDFAAIRTALDTIVSSMNSMFGQIREMADEVARGSKQVAAGSQSLAQGAAEQAATVQQLTASLQEITLQAKNSAQYVQKADRLASDTKKQVSAENSQMERLISAMTKIGESSGKIEKIIKTIEDITFQTNILALNAAVEAARAGEAGRGFSVVADEVRNLASKSAAAAKDTSALIRDSIEAVDGGRKVADETAASLGQIVQGVESMTELFGSISRSAAEQAEAIGQLNRGSDQISKVVQANSATAEQSAATSEELSGLAENLNGMLEKIRLREKPAFEQNQAAD